MRSRWIALSAEGCAVLAAATTAIVLAQPVAVREVVRPGSQQVDADAMTMIREGRQTFRHDTFGDEAFWGDALQLHQAVAGQKLGGIGPGLSPKAALGVGLKVDADVIPADLAQRIKQGRVDLDDPATTVALLKLNAVVGVKAFADERGGVKSVGITCAICHSTV